MTLKMHPPLCWSLAGLLVWAGAAKALNPQLFAENIMGYRLVSWPVAAGLALYLPWLELIVATALCVPRWRSGALLLASVLFTAFTVILATTWWRGIDVTCGCFGEAGRVTIGWAFWRAVLLAAVGWFGVLHSRDPSGRD